MNVVFSADYAASLVERARLGATFTLRYGYTRRGLQPHWLPIRTCGKLRAHWIEWYRETDAAWRVADTGLRWNLAYGTDDAEAFREAFAELGDLRVRFHASLSFLFAWFSLPAEWTDDHREAAREIGRS